MCTYVIVVVVVVAACVMISLPRRAVRPPAARTTDAANLSSVRPKLVYTR